MKVSLLERPLINGSGLKKCLPFLNISETSVHLPVLLDDFISARQPCMQMAGGTQKAMKFIKWIFIVVQRRLVLNIGTILTHVGNSIPFSQMWKKKREITFALFYILGKCVVEFSGKLKNEWDTQAYSIEKSLRPKTPHDTRCNCL